MQLLPRLQDDLVDKKTTKRGKSPRLMNDNIKGEPVCFGPGGGAGTSFHTADLSPKPCGGCMQPGNNVEAMQRVGDTVIKVKRLVPSSCNGHASNNEALGAGFAARSQRMYSVDQRQSVGEAS